MNFVTLRPLSGRGSLKDQRSEIVSLTLAMTKKGLAMTNNMKAK